MAMRTIDFSSNITDGTAGGAIGDNTLIVGGVKFEITAAGNWTANFDNGRFNFSEDSSVGGQNFSIKVTTLDGSVLDFYDYQITVVGAPAHIGGSPSPLAVDNATWSDSTISGSGLGGDYFRALFSHAPPERSFSNSVTIEDLTIYGQTYSGTMSFWIDNLTIETNMVPVVSGWGAADNQIYTTGAGLSLGIDIGTAASVMDSDSSGWDGGRIRFSMTGRVPGQDALNLVNEGTAAGQIGISGTNVTYGGVVIGTFVGGGTASSTLTVTFNAAATKEAIDALLGNVVYSNTSATATGTRGINVSVTDALGSASTTATTTITLTVPTVAPTVTATGATTSFTEGGSAADIFSGVTVATNDNGQTIKGLTLSVSGVSNGAAEVLTIGGTAVALTHGSSGTTVGGHSFSVSVSGGVATVTLTGLTLTETSAGSLIDAITYSNSSENPTAGPRTITLTGVTDSGAANNFVNPNVSATITVVAVNDAPVVTAGGGSASFTEDAGATQVAPGLTLNDVDNTTLVSATVKITGGFQAGEDQLSFTNTSSVTFGNISSVYNALTGEMTLTSAGGVATLAQWQAALRAVAYDNSSDNPNTGTRTISYTAHDGSDSSVATTRNVTVTAVNDVPVVSAGSGSAGFTEGGTAVVVASGLTVSDADSTTFASASVSISGNFRPAEDVLTFSNTSSAMFGNITASYNPLTGVLSLTSANSSATVQQWQAALRAVTYNNTAEEPHSGPRTISFAVNDGVGVSMPDTRNVTISLTNDAPTLAASSGSATYTENGSAVAIAGDITVGDVDNSTLSSAQVWISSNYQLGQDVLAFLNSSSLTFGDIAGSFSAGTGILTLTSASGMATLAQWQAALRAVVYANSSDNPDTTERTISFVVNDSELNSVVVTRGVTVIAVNDAPVVSAGNGDLAYSENDAATAIAPSLTVQDADNPTLVSATVAITTNFHAGEDRLGFSNTNATTFGNITASYDETTGVLSLASSGGTATLAQWQAALRAVTYQNTSDAPDAGGRTISFSVHDGVNLSTLSGRNITITAINDAPVVTSPADQETEVGQTLTFNAANGNLLSVQDPDSGNGALSVTLSVTSGHLTLSGLTGLTFIVGDGVGDGTMTFIGSKAAINAALNGLQFAPVANQSGAVTLSLSVNDQGNTGQGGAQSDSASVDIDVIRPIATAISVDATSPDGLYGIGAPVTLTVNFGTDVIVNTAGGVPTLLLETGATDRVATYVSGSGSNVLVFTYVVQAGDLSGDLNYASTTGLRLNGATITDIDGQAANLTLPSLGSAGALAHNADLVIDGIAPSVTSVEMPQNGTYDIGQQLAFTVNLSEAVTINTTGGTPRIAVMLDTGGTVWADYVSGSGSNALTFQFTVVAGQRDLSGITLGNSIALNGAVVTDPAGNNLNATLAAIGATAGVKIDTIHNFDPSLIGSLKMTMAEGATKALTTADLFFSDPDDLPAGVTFTATGLSHGQILVNGVVKTSFTGAELAAGLVRFRHDGSEGTRAGFNVTVEDGDEDGSAPVASRFDITVTPVDDAPTALTLKPILQTLAENTSTTRKIAVADIKITDVDGGLNPIKLSGADAQLFVVENGKLWLRAGAKLDFETNPDLDVTVSTGKLNQSLHIGVKDVNEAPEVHLKNMVTQLAEDVSTAKDRVVARIVVTDDALGFAKLGLTGADAGMFRIVKGNLVLRAGVELDFATNPRLDVRVTVDDPTIGKGVDGHADLQIKLIDNKPPEVIGSKGSEILKGTAKADIMDGQGGNDALRGGGGNDTLIGGAGHDTLSGGAGADVFRFNAVSESGAGQSGYVNNSGLSVLSGQGRRDVITDFEDHRDIIDLSRIDANSHVAGNQAFSLVSGNALPGTSGALLVRQFDFAGSKNDRTIIYADVNGDRIADLQIELLGLHKLSADNFIL